MPRPLGIRTDTSVQSVGLIPRRFASRFIYPINNRKQPATKPSRNPGRGRAHAGGACGWRVTAILKNHCAATNATTASVHAHGGTILISEVSRVSVSFLTCIDLSTFSLQLPRLLAAVREVRAASHEKRTHRQRRRDEEKHEARLPD